MNGWWTIKHDALRSMLERAHAGEDPSALLVELYANSDVEVAE